KRYNNLDEEERTSIEKPLVIGLSYALLFKKSEMKVYVFNSVGTLIETVQIVRAGEELKVPPGIYFVRTEWNGKQVTQKVWVGH
ncbi:MAG: T9SS type A sorting domain-containing protein, partial [Bacteroidia bacterium]